eukprot:COSAG04_NODE_3626_length_2662_cov_94.554038_3_plen_313_part_00
MQESQGAPCASLRNFIVIDSLYLSTQVLAGGDADEPELVDQETPITIKQLFTHTAGLPPLGPSQAGKINARVQRARNPSNLAEHCEALAAGALSAQPGAKWQYGSCLTVLGRCVEVWSGQTFDVFLQEEIFDRLGMADTGFKLPQSKLHRLHTNYLKTGEQEMEAMETNTEALTSVGGVFNGSGGLVGSTADYMKFAIMLCNEGIGANDERVLGPRSVQHMAMNRKIVMLSRFVALSVSLIQKVSLFQICRGAWTLRRWGLSRSPRQQWRGLGSASGWLSVRQLACPRLACAAASLTLKHCRQCSTRRPRTS